MNAIKDLAAYADLMARFSFPVLCGPGHLQFDRAMVIHALVVCAGIDPYEAQRIVANSAPEELTVLVKALIEADSARESMELNVAGAMG